MKKFTVTLVIVPSAKERTVTVSAMSAVDACTKAESLNPGTLARSADLVPASS